MTYIDEDGWTVLTEADILRHSGRVFTDMGIDPEEALAATTKVMLTEDSTRAYVAYHVMKEVPGDVARAALARNEEDPE